MFQGATRYNKKETQPEDFVKGTKKSGKGKG